MSKMESAQMAVVRFTESDVIVASGGEILHLNNGFTDVGGKNGVMTFRGIDYSVNSSSGTYPASLYDIIRADYGSDGLRIEATGDGNHTIDNLFEVDDGSTTYQVNATSGNYHWDGSMWKHQ